MSKSLPLAHLLRPKTLEQFVGQSHLLGTNGTIRQLCEQQQLCSMILWGPPGCGKTSLVHVLEHYWQIPIVTLSAVNAGIKDIKAITQSSPQLTQTSVVFVDEIHRFNKTQQDAFLPYVESGQVVLLGATSENPAFSINKALLSRLKVFTLKPLDKNDMTLLVKKSLAYLSESTKRTLEIEKNAVNSLLNLANGDARKLLGTIDIAASLLSPTKLKITNDLIAAAGGSSIGDFDKNGDHYYDILSAFHKSIRGSSVDGGLYWFARLLMCSDDIIPIARRLLAISTEDIGNADPKAMQVCLNAWDIYHRVGKSEGERAIAQAIVYCALAPKSNAVYRAFSDVKAYAAKTANAPVPLHLRNSVSELSKQEKHGEGYQYAHNFEYAFAPEQEYMPEGHRQVDFYKPSDRGFEKRLQQKIDFLHSLREQNQ